MPKDVPVVFINGNPFDARGGAHEDVARSRAPTPSPRAGEAISDFAFAEDEEEWREEKDSKTETEGGTAGVRPAAAKSHAQRSGQEAGVAAAVAAVAGVAAGFLWRKM